MCADTLIDTNSKVSTSAFTLLTQNYFLLPPNVAEQLEWSRFVNVYGSPKRNVSCELHTEHLNQLVKTAIDGLGANKTENAISRDQRQWE